MKSIQRYVLASVMLTMSLFIGHLAYATHFNFVNLLDWQDSPSLVSGSELGNRPAIARAPNGDLMMVYSKWNDASGAQSDPFFVLSQDDGDTWSAPASIVHPDQDGTTPTAVDVTFDQASTAHALWVEEGGSNSSVFSIHYAQRQAQGDGSWVVSRTLFDSEVQEPIRQASIATGLNSSLHAVWAQTTPVNMFDFESTIQYATSVNGGLTWTQLPIFLPTDTSLNSSPVIVADTNGGLHVAWERNLGGGSFAIYYSTRSSGSTNWSSPVEISIDNVQGNKLFEKPDIVVSTSSVYVTYTYRDPDDKGNQLVYIAQCTFDADCTGGANWASNDISGQFFTVNSTAPFNVVANLTVDNDVVHVFYHGFANSEANGDERIWSTNSCDSNNWENIVIDEVETDLNRVINPSILSFNNKLHLAIEQIDVSSDSSIYYTSSDFACGGPPTIYLPLILTN